MKKTISLLLAAFAFSFCFTQTACNSADRVNGEKMAKSGDTRIMFVAFGASKQNLKEALCYALSERKWIIISDGDPVVAQLNHGGQNARISAFVEDGKIVFETKGSHIDNVPYVPIRFIDNLTKTIRASIVVPKK